MKRWIAWFIIALTLAAIVMGDLLPTFAEAQEIPVAATSSAVTVHVAQLQPPGKRRSLLDMLFGRNQDDQQVQEQPAQQTAPKAPRKASLPPAKPEITKSPTATRLAVMGDSLATDVANALQRFYADDPNLVVVPMAVGSSGFIRTDYFDWSKTLDDQIAKNGFDLAVMVVGINDRQTIRADGASYKALTDGWTQIYRTRLDTFVQKFRAAKKPLIWVGLPPMQQASFSQAMNQISNLQRLAVFAGGAEFLDVYDRFLDESGKYSTFGPDLNGQRVRMRKDDGIHFSTGGADKLAFYLSQTIKLFYRGGGSVGLDVADPLNGTDAQLMVRPPYQGLGQIRLLEVAGAVIPLTQTPKRAAELLTADPVPAPGDGFDLGQLVNAPEGRVDAFGVGTMPAEDIVGGQ